MTVNALLELNIKPDVVDEAHAMFKDILDDTRAFEGCEGVALLVDQTDPAHWFLYETWASPEADQKYRQYREGAGALDLGKILAGPPTMTLLTPAS